MATNDRKKFGSKTSPQKLFTPNNTIMEGVRGIASKVTLSDSLETNQASTGSFRYDQPGSGLKSTQELKVDWSNFSNHTFFNSAQSKVNIAFDRLINYYPFDGRESEVEAFEDSLTGYEAYILRKFPKHKGYLYFSGTQKGEDQSNGYPAKLGTYISVVDSAGSVFPEISSNKTGRRCLQPSSGTFLYQMQLYIPPQSNKNQTIFQFRDSETKSISAAISSSNNLGKCDVIWCVSSGSDVNLITSASIEKGKWVPLALEFDRSVGVNRLKVYVSGALEARSARSFDMGSIDFSSTDFTIGSGSNFSFSRSKFLPSNDPVFRMDNTLSGAIDEFRFFKRSLTLKEIKDTEKKEVYPGTNQKLGLYFKFNEPPGDYGAQSVVLDSSGNSLHTKISNYQNSLRISGSLLNPIEYEDISRCPVLFPDFPDIVSLNTELLASGSEYDNVNPNLITHFLPQHYLEEGYKFQGKREVESGIGNAYTGGGIPGSGKIESPQLLTAFMFVYAKFFDEIKMFIDHFSRAVHVQYDEEDSVVDKFLPYVAKYYGFELPAIYSNSDPIQFIKGENLLTSQSRAVHSLSYVQNQIWRRILINLREIFLSKGTNYSVKALIRAIGIDPDNNFSIREYGGPDRRSLLGLRLRRTEVAASLNMSGSISSTTSLRSASLVDALTLGTAGGTGGVAGEPSDGEQFTIVVPVSAGGTGSTITVRLVPNLSSLPGANQVFVVRATPNNPNRNRMIAAFNGTDDPSWDGSKIAYGSGVTGGPTGIKGITASAGSDAAKVTLTCDSPGFGGNSVVLTATATVTLNPVQSGPLSLVGGGLSINDLGVSPTIPRIQSNFLSSSRVELGYPEIKGQMVEKDKFYPHGVSNNLSDGLLTSGSFTVEATYKFKPEMYNKGTPYTQTQSLMRIHATGSGSPASTQSVLSNLIIVSGSQNSITSSGSEIRLYTRPSFRSTSEKVHVLVLTGVNVFDGSNWNISFGRYRSDQRIDNITGSYLSPTISDVSSSYFLRAARQSFGEIKDVYMTSSFFQEVSNGDVSKDAFQSFSSQYNSLGPFLVVGSQSMGGNSSGFHLNDATVPGAAREMTFEGQISQIRFWSKGLLEKEWKEHVRNYKSFGVLDPTVNYNFYTTATGSFNRLRMDITTDQALTASNASGGIQLLDFTQNNFNMSGSGFEVNKSVILPETFYYSILSPKFDMGQTDEKVRVRSYSNPRFVEEDPYASTTPVYEVRKSEAPEDDNRYSIEMSSVKALDEDIMRLFSTLEFFDNALGDPNLMYDEFYPDIDQMRKIYFNRLTGKMNLQLFFEMFKWFDTTFESLISQLIPKATNFLGVNYVIESHVLERSRFRYLNDYIYIDPCDRQEIETTSFLDVEGLIRKM